MQFCFIAFSGRLLSCCLEVLVQKKRNKVLNMGGEKAIKKQHDKGKLTARERMVYLFDDGKFTETGLYVQHRTTALDWIKKKSRLKLLLWVLAR